MLNIMTIYLFTKNSPTKNELEILPHIYTIDFIASKQLQPETLMMAYVEYVELLVKYTLEMEMRKIAVISVK